MLNLNPLSPIRQQGSDSTKPLKRANEALESSAAVEPESGYARNTRRDRRRMPDRRGRRTAAKMMDRRQGLERRRSAIDISI